MAAGRAVGREVAAGRAERRDVAAGCDEGRGEAAGRADGRRRGRQRRQLSQAAAAAPDAGTKAVERLSGNKFAALAVEEDEEIVEQAPANVKPKAEPKPGPPAAAPVPMARPCLRADGASSKPRLQTASHCPHDVDDTMQYMCTCHFNEPIDSSGMCDGCGWRWPARQWQTLNTVAALKARWASASASSREAVS